MALAVAHVDILANTGRFERDLQTKLSRAGTAAGKSFNKAFTRAVGRIKVDTNVTAKLTKSVGKDGNKAGKQFGKTLLKGMAAPLAAVGKLVTTALSSVMDGGGSGLGKAKMFSGMSIAAAAAATAVAPLAGFLAAIPAAAAGAAAGVSTLAVAFQNMGAAISAGWTGDLAEFDKALKQLTPSANAVAKEIVGLKPAFDGLQDSAQQAFFAPLVGQVEQLSGVLSGPLQAGMTNLSAAMGEGAANMANFFATPEAGAQLQTMFDGLAQSVRDATPGIMALTQGLLDMAAAGAGKLGGIGVVFEKIGAQMTQMAASGQVAAWIDAAAQAATQLGGAFAQLMPGLIAFASALGGIGGAVRANLGPAFAGISTAMTALSGPLSTVATMFSTVLGTVLPPIAKLIGALGTTVGNILGPAFAALAPIVQQISAQLGPVLSQAVATLVPQLTLLGQQLGGFLAGAFRILGPIIQALLPIVTGTFNAIVGVISGAIKFLSGILQFFSNLFQGNWKKMWEGLLKAGQGIWDMIVNGVLVFLGKGILKIIGWIGKTLGKLWSNIWKGVSNTVRGWVDTIRLHIMGFKDFVIDIFKNAGKWLIQAGKNIIGGLIDGIKSMFGWVGDTIGGITQKIRDFLPFSPAKEGPLSGSGNPENSGRKIGAMLAGGIASQRGLVASSMRDLTKTASPWKPTARGFELPTDAARARANPLMTGSATGLGAPGYRDRRTVEHRRTTTVTAPITVRSASTNPAAVARRTADRLARFATT